MTTSLRVKLSLVIALFIYDGATVYAQSTNTDWNGSRQFRSANDRVMDLTQADMQKKATSGYYQSWNQNLTINTTTMSTTSIGAYNQTTIGNGVSGLSVVTGATDSGCNDASISVSGSVSAGSVKSCGK